MEWNGWLQAQTALTATGIKSVGCWVREPVLKFCTKEKYIVIVGTRPTICRMLVA